MKRFKGSKHDPHEETAPPEKLQVVFTAEAWRKINGYIKAVEGEVSGLGRAVVINKTTIQITDIYLWKQECSSATTEVVDHNAVFDLVSELDGQGVPTEELCVWWHSHYNFQSFFSGTDVATIEGWVNDKFLVAVVGNQAEEYKACVAIKSPLRVTVSDVPVSYEEAPEVEAAKEILVKAQAEAEALIAATRGVGDPAITEEVKAKVKVDVPHPIGFKTSDSRLSPIYTGGMTVWETELEHARLCGCPDCEEFITGITTQFSYTKHYWDGNNKMYLPKSVSPNNLTKAEEDELVKLRAKEYDQTLNKKEIERITELEVKESGGGFYGS